MVHCSVGYCVPVPSDSGWLPVQPPVHCFVTSTLPREGLTHVQFCSKHIDEDVRDTVEVRVRIGMRMGMGSGWVGWGHEDVCVCALHYWDLIHWGSNGD